MLYSPHTSCLYIGSIISPPHVAWLQGFQMYDELWCLFPRQEAEGPGGLHEGSPSIDVFACHGIPPSQQPRQPHINTWKSQAGGKSWSWIQDGLPRDLCRPGFGPLNVIALCESLPAVMSSDTFGLEELVTQLRALIPPEPEGAWSMRGNAACLSAFMMQRRVSVSASQVVIDKVIISVSNACHLNHLLLAACRA